MATSRIPGPTNPPAGMCRIPARTPGPLGWYDQADLNFTTLLGDTPGPLGVRDGASPDLPWALGALPTMGHWRTSEGEAIAAGSNSDSMAPTRQAVGKLTVSEKALELLRGIETLRLKPYDDQTGKEISEWVAGATIGFGHLIAKNDWNTYKGGITEEAANALFSADLAPFVTRVQKAISVDLAQQEFDALVILAFNIGPAISDSSVVKLINDPKAQTSYASLELAWKAWNKSQGKEMAGLTNRRKCEWDIYSKGVYQRW